MLESNKKPIIKNEILNDICKIYFDKDRNKLEKKYPVLFWKELDECSLTIPNIEKLGGVDAIKFNFIYFRFYILIDENNILHEKYKRFEMTKEKINCFVFQEKNPYRGIQYFKQTKTINHKIEETEILN